MILSHFFISHHEINLFDSITGACLGMRTKITISQIFVSKNIPHICFKKYIYLAGDKLQEKASDDGAQELRNPIENAG